MIEEPIIEEKTDVEETTGGKKPEEEKIEPTDELDDDFEKFKRSKTVHKIDIEEETNRDRKGNFIPDDDDIIEIEDFQVQMFLGFCFTMLDGFHVFVYKYISKYELKDEDMSLSEKEQESLMSYFKTKRIIEFIKKLPTELIGIFHMEWMYYRRYKQITKEKEAEEAKNDKLLLVERMRKFNKKRSEKKAEEKTAAKKPLVKKVKKKVRKKEPADKKE
jgi:hypothetical protein